MNIYRYTFNGPINALDPFGLAATEYGAQTGGSAGHAGGLGGVGTRLGCTFSNIGGLVELASSVTGGNAVGVISSVTNLGSCTGSQVTLLMKGPGGKLVEFGGFIARPYGQLIKNARDPRLKSIINKLFNKGNGRFGNGSAMDARIWEKINKVVLRKDQHLKKLWDEMHRLQKVVNVRPGDKAIAQALLKDIVDALGKSW